mmetsp:Transcript_33977/g.44850  ORF Transcript_33977/g.44850 Transcript_33977/m.44850 type:complete len:433 (+) Transcript_33977:206-1504(+)
MPPKHRERRVPRASAGGSTRRARAGHLAGHSWINLSQVSLMRRMIKHPNLKPNREGKACQMPGKKAIKAKILQSTKLMGAVTAFQEEGAHLQRSRRNAAKHKYPWLLKDTKLPTGVNTNHFDFNKVLGTGLFGVVWLARYKRYQGYVAVKQMAKAAIETNVHRILQEKDAMLDLAGHPFIPCLFGTFQNETDVFFVMEYIPGGELFSRLISSKNGRFPVEVAKFYACEVLCALEHAHSKGYVYRDLKPENVLIDEEGHIRLVDFGFTCKLDEDGKAQSIVGTPAYQSPEQLNAKTNGGYTQAVDMWAFGCLIYEMLFSRTPFEGKTRKESPYQIYARVQKGKVSFPRRFPGHLRETLKGLFELDFKKRFTTVRSVKLSSYFSRVDWLAVLDYRAAPPFTPELLSEADSHYFHECQMPKQSPFPRDQSIFYGF